MAAEKLLMEYIWT